MITQQQFKELGWEGDEGEWVIEIPQGDTVYEWILYHDAEEYQIDSKLSGKFATSPITHFLGYLPDKKALEQLMSWLGIARNIKPKRYIGTTEPSDKAGSYYNAGIIWVEREDGNFEREDGVGARVRADAFMEFVRRGWLALIVNRKDYKP